MTDLEDLWESLPTAPAPTTRILARGRAASGLWPAARRSLRPVVALAAVGGAFIAGTLASGSPGGVSAGPTPDAPVPPSLVSFGTDLSPAASCEDLLATYVDRGLGLVSAYGWGQPFYGYAEGFDGRTTLGLPDMANDRALQSNPVAAAPVAGPVAGQANAPATPGTSRVTASETGTNVQEAGVDEPDNAKTDGDVLLRLRDDELITYDVTGERVERLGSLTLRNLEDGEILLTGDTVIAIGGDATSSRSDLTGQRRGTRVQTIDISDPASPAVTAEVTYEAAAATVRQHGDTVRVVLSAGLPDLPFVRPGRRNSEAQALEQNRTLVEESTLTDWLPGYDAGEGRADLLDCANVAVPSPKVGLDTTAVVTFGAAEPTAPTAFGLAGATSIAYESEDRLYLAAGAEDWMCRCVVRGGSSGTSYLFEFALSADGARHVASGEVEGSIRDRWSMDEADGVLRVAVGPSSETGNFNSIVTLERKGDDLVETGRLDRLGVNEQIQSVRWQDDLAIVVTFRQIDPLYIIDLSGEPTLLSELKIPGFSSYLHPLGTDRLIGVGEGPTPGSRRSWGAQMGLFDVRDLTDVRQIDVWNYRAGTQAIAGQDPRAFTWVADERTVLTVIRRGNTGFLSMQRLVDGQLENEMVEVEYGQDVYEVRTLQLPDGRILLVTGEDVEFLDL
jgi:hypothetical protein